MNNDSTNQLVAGGASMDTIYLDNNATTQVSREVLEVMQPFYHDLYGNPSSIHTFGSQVAEKVEDAREQVAKLLMVSSKDILFTSGGTESDNTAIRSALEISPEKRHIVTSAVEHPAIRSLCLYFAKQGYRITEVPVNGEGELDMDYYEKSLTSDTAVVSLMWANNETGVLFPVEEAAQLARERGILFHTDAVQAVGKVPIDLKNIPVDMLSLSGHKLHGPKGVGVLYVRRGMRFRPTILGGHQERGRRAGTENTPAVIGLGKACELASQGMENKNFRIKQLRDKLERGIIDRVPGTRVNGRKAPRLPNTTNISFEYVEGEGILLLLDELGICASSGSACTSGSLEPSHVLLAMGVSAATAQGAIRFSLSAYNRKEEIDLVIEKIPGIIRKLRQMSPLWPRGEHVSRAA
jgi:cysteine desulfurase